MDLRSDRLRCVMQGSDQQTTTGETTDEQTTPQPVGGIGSGGLSHSARKEHEKAVEYALDSCLDDSDPYAVRDGLYNHLQQDEALFHLAKATGSATLAEKCVRDDPASEVESGLEVAAADRLRDRAVELAEAAVDHERQAVANIAVDDAEDFYAAEDFSEDWLSQWATEAGR